MEQQRFTDLAILNIERDIVNKITSSKILEKYSTSNRKIILVWNNILCIILYIM